MRGTRIKIYYAIPGAMLLTVSILSLIKVKFHRFSHYGVIEVQIPKYTDIPSNRSHLLILV